MIFKFSNGTDKLDQAFKWLDLTPNSTKTLLQLRWANEKANGLASIVDWGVVVAGGTGNGLVSAELIETDTAAEIHLWNPDEVFALDEHAQRAHGNLSSLFNMQKSGYDAKDEGSPSKILMVDKLGGRVGDPLVSRYSIVQKGGTRWERDGTRFNIANFLRLRVSVQEDEKAKKDDLPLKAYAWLAFDF